MGLTSSKPIIKKKVDTYDIHNNNELNPYLIVVAGPTASGKGSAPSKLQKLLNLSTKYKSVLIDDLVEANPHYRKGVQNFINDKKNGPEKLTDEQIIDIFNNPTPDDLKIFDKLYFESRKNTDCNTGSIVETSKENPSSNTCDTKNDNILKQAFEKSDNIVFETTGQWWVGWLFEQFKDQIQRNKYDIIVVYSIVDLCNLIIRNKDRAKKSIREFLADNKKPPPRLPDIRKEKYKEIVNKIIQTFKSNNYKCLYTDKPYSKGCIRFIILDNRTKNIKNPLLYDSFENSEIGKTKNTKHINIYADDCTQNGGNKQVTRKKNKNKKTKTRKN